MKVHVPFPTLMTQTHRHPAGPWLALVALVAALVALYLPGTEGPFVLDDFVNLASSPKLLLTELSPAALADAALSSHAGPLRRPVAMLSFALNTYPEGRLDPSTIKLTNVLLHAANTVLVFLLTHSLTLRLQASQGREAPLHPRWSAVLVSALWALHPLHVSTVLYAVQRMTELAALFTFLGTLLYVRGRTHLIDGRTRTGVSLIVIGVVGCGLLAALSKENGALLPVLLIPVELIFFRLRLGPGSPRILRVAILALLSLPALALVGYLGHVWITADGPVPGRDFSVTQRLLTQPRVLSDYLGRLFWPDIDRMSLLHPGYPVSRGLLHPPTTLYAILGWAVVSGGALYAAVRGRVPALAFGVLWFLAGHLLESTVVPLELVFEHRNYLPSYGPLFALGYLLTSVPLLARIRPILYGPLLAAVVLGVAAQLQLRVGEWSSHANFYAAELARNPSSARAWTSLAQAAYLNGSYDEASDLYRRAAELEPDEVGHLVGVLRTEIAAADPPPSQALLERITVQLSQRVVSRYGAGQMVGLGMDFRDKPAWPGAALQAGERVLAKGAENPGWPTTELRAAAYVLLAELRIRQDEFPDAVQALHGALALSPDRRSARLALADLLIRQGHRREAAEELGRLRAASLSPGERIVVDRLEALIGDGAGGQQTGSVPRNGRPGGRPKPIPPAE